MLEPGKTISLYKSIIVAYVIARIACDLVGIACCVIMVLVTRFLKLISCNLTINAKTSAKNKNKNSEEWLARLVRLF